MRINNVGRIIMDNMPVHDFLECVTTPYNNDHGVGIMTNLFNQERDLVKEDYISVFAGWKGEAPVMPFHEETVIARFHCSTIDQLMETFGINDASGINTITPEHLFNLYRQGKAEIECTVSHLYDCYSLYFSTAPSSSPEGGELALLAKDDDENEHTVTLLLDTPEQFIRYTREHFSLEEISVSEKENLECGVYYYLENADTIFQNKWGVEFEPNGKEPGEKDNECSLTISASWPSCSEDDDPTGLSVIYEGFDVSVLIEKFGITRANGLEDITPRQLQKLYQQGKACIYCWLDDEEVGLYFRLQKNRSMIASEYYLGNGSQERIFEVHGLLETPEQFIDYTRHYYRYVRLFK